MTSGHYLSNDEIVAIILMTIALTWFLVSCGYKWRDNEAHLLVERLEDDNYKLRHQLEELDEPIPFRIPKSYDATEMACYQMLCGPTVTMFSGCLAIVENGSVYPDDSVYERQVLAGCQFPRECQAYARGQLEWLDIRNVTGIEYDEPDPHDVSSGG